MTTVSFVSEKGGVGKTTSCYHVAVGLQRFHNKKVLVVDADYQRGGLTGRFFPKMIENFGEDRGTTTLFHCFQSLYSAASKPPLVDIESWNGVIDVIPSDHRLSTVTVDKLPGTKNIRENNRLYLSHLQVIADVIERIGSDYDYVLIDSHPEVSDVLRSVIYASDYCVSPVKLDRQSSIGVATVIAEMNNVNADVEMLGSGLGKIEDWLDTKFAGSIGMMAREYAGDLKYTEDAEFNRLKRTGTIFDTYVTEGDGLRMAAAQRCPVYDISIPNAIKQSEQFEQLTKEFLIKCP
jgi:chromosome partitioning protein